MKKELISKVIWTVLILVGLYLLWLKSPYCSTYYYNQAKKSYYQGNYDQAIRLFERSLLTNSKNNATRFMYVQALSKSIPDYHVQQSLYKMANSQTQDSARKYARTYIVKLKKSLLYNLEDNYIYNAILNKDIIRWSIDSFPLKVFIEKPSDIPEYYTKNIERAFTRWSDRTSFVTFTQTNKIEEANIIVQFEPYAGDNCTKDICKYVVATTYPEIDKHHKLINMTITFYKSNNSGKSYTPEEIYNSALHEIGHCLGILGHSDKKSDIMYSSTNSTNKLNFLDDEFLRKDISQRDLNTITLFYRLAPTVTNVDVWNNDNLYYPPLILGEDEEILNNKLAELEKYIKQYPDFATGYINISTIYSNLGREKEAFRALDKAQELAISVNEKYLVQYNRAVIYFNKQDFDTALIYAQKAKELKPGDGINSFIKDIIKIKQNK